MSDAPDPGTFVSERFPAQLNRSLAEQERATGMAQRAQCCRWIDGRGTGRVDLPDSRPEDCDLMKDELFSDKRGAIGDFEFGHETARVFDLGCSTGTTFLGLDPHLPKDVAFVGVDSSPDMLEKAEEKLAQAHVSRPYELRCGALEEVVVEDASVVVLNLTLQFVRPIQRPEVIRRIARASSKAAA